MQRWTRMAWTKVYFAWVEVFAFVIVVIVAAVVDVAIAVYYGRPIFILLDIQAMALLTYVKLSMQTHTHNAFENNAWINITAIWLRFLGIHSVWSHFIPPVNVSSSFLNIFVACSCLSNEPTHFFSYRFSFNNKCAKFISLSLSLSHFLFNFSSS